MRNAFAASIVGLSLLAGCTNQQAVLETWKGDSESKLLANWGAPNRTAVSGDVKYLTYEIRNFFGYVVGSNTFIVSATSKKVLGGTCSGMCL